MTKDSKNNDRNTKTIKYDGNNGEEVAQNIINCAKSKDQKHADLLEVYNYRAFYPKTTASYEILQQIATNAEEKFNEIQVAKAQALLQLSIDVETLLKQHEDDIEKSNETLTNITTETLTSANADSVLSALGCVDGKTTAAAGKQLAQSLHDISTSRYNAEDESVWTTSPICDRLQDPDDEDGEELKAVQDLNIGDRVAIIQTCHNLAANWLSTEIKKRLPRNRLALWKTKTGWQLLDAINPQSARTPLARITKILHGIIQPSGHNLGERYLNVVNSINSASEVAGLDDLSASDLLQVFGMQTLYNNITQAAPILATTILAEQNIDKLAVKDIEATFEKYKLKLTGLGEMNLPKTEVTNMTTDQDDQDDEEIAMLNDGSPPWQEQKKKKNHHGRGNSGKPRKGRLSTYRDLIMSHVNSGTNPLITREDAHKKASAEAGFASPIEWSTYTRPRGRMPSMFDEQWPYRARKCKWKGEENNTTAKTDQTAKTDDANTLAKILEAMNTQANETKAQLKEFANMIGSE